MNERERNRKMVERYKEAYPPGTRVLLLSMGDDPRPIEDNTRGTVKLVDDMGTLHCDFDNGRRLGIVSGEDSFRKLTDEELAEEQMAKLPRVNGEMVALTPDDEGVFMGYVTDRKWNGWECPLFPKSSADKIMEYINNSVGDMSYDAEADSYTMKYFEGDEMECFDGEDYLVNGNVEHLYPIGSHSWIWDHAPEQNDALYEDNAPVMGM